MKTVSIKLNRRVSGFQIQELEPGSRVYRDPESNIDPDIREYHVPGVPTAVEWELEVLKTRISQLEIALQSAREESFASGFQEGQAEAAQQFNIELTSVKEQFEKMAVQVKTQADESLMKSEFPLLELAFGISRTILKQELKSEDVCSERIKSHLSKMLMEVIDQEKVSVQINPELLSKLNDSNSLDNIDPAMGRTVRYIGNPEVSPGDCILETPDFTIDGQLDKQLLHLENQLKADIK